MNSMKSAKGIVASLQIFFSDMRFDTEKIHFKYGCTLRYNFCFIFYKCCANLAWRFLLYIYISLLCLIDM